MRLKVCKKCGKTFQTETGHSEAYFCPECSVQARRDSIIRERNCEICGISFFGYPAEKYCQTCREKIKKEQRKAYKRNKSIRPLGSIDTCKKCGGDYVVKSGLQKYCPACAEMAIKEKIREKKKKYNFENKERIKIRKKEMKINGKICVICGKPFQAYNNSVTCSEECAKELRRIRQNESDIKRGKRQLPANQKYVSNRPSSGIVGVTWRNNGKWQAVYKKHYIGLFDTIEEASEAIEKYKNG